MVITLRTWRAIALVSLSSLVVREMVLGWSVRSRFVLLQQQKDTKTVVALPANVELTSRLIKVTVNDTAPPPPPPRPRGESKSPPQPLKETNRKKPENATRRAGAGRVARDHAELVDSLIAKGNLRKRLHDLHAMSTGNMTQVSMSFQTPQVTPPATQAVNTKSKTAITIPTMTLNVTKSTTKLHRWHSSGIKFQDLLHFLNDSYTGAHLPEPWYEGQFGTFPVFIVNTEQSGVKLWIKSSDLNRRNPKTIGSRMFRVHPIFNEALQDFMSLPSKYPGLSRVMETTGILPLAFRLDDYIDCPHENHVGDDSNNSAITIPFFTLCSSLRCPNSLVLPTYSMLGYTRGYNSPEEWHAQAKVWNTEYPWESKIPKLHWRGGCSYYRKTEKSKSVRAQVLKKSVQDDISPFVDIKPVGGFLNCPLWTQKKIALGNFSAPEASMNYRAVLDMDGNSWSERFPRLLCYNSAVVKMEPKFVDYLWPTLKPWVHYIPATVETFDKIARFVADNKNEEPLKGIVRNANKWCSEHMRRSKLKSDFLSLLDGYVEELDRHDSGSWLDVWSKSYHSVVNAGKMDFFHEPSLGRDEVEKRSTDFHVQPMRI